MCNQAENKRIKNKQTWECSYEKQASRTHPYKQTTPSLTVSEARKLLLLSFNVTPLPKTTVTDKETKQRKCCV